MEPVNDRIESMNSPSVDSDTLLNARSRWRKVWQRLGVAPPASAFDRLLQAYAEPHRAYHTLVHVLDCLAQLDWARPWAERDTEIEIALWFHDVVYDPHASDNEEQSAAWAGRVLEASHIAPEVVERVRGLILATQHIAPPANSDAALLVDIDLSIMGRVEAEFACYDADIRREYYWVLEATYCAARAHVLESFLQRPTVFYTAAFQQRYEAQARDTLTRAIRRLRETRI